MDEPVRDEGPFTFIDIGETGLTPEELEAEFANDDPEAHTHEVTVVSQRRKIQRSAREAT